MSINTEIFAKSEEAINSEYQRLVHERKWIDYPMIVSIETFSKCNAKCTFCPYPSLARKGEKLQSTRVYSLLDELATFPVPPARLNFSRVNEPFLDTRLFNFLEYAAKILPKTNLILFTNGQTITDNVLDKLNNIKTFSHLSVSFNEHDALTYNKVMSLDQSKTLPRIENIHKRTKDGTLNFKVSLSRVGTSNANDSEFIEWCKSRFPAIPTYSMAKFNWVGTSNTGDTLLAPDAGCTQWFSLHILANGESAFCCIDGEGHVMEMNIDEHSLLSIYNTPEKRRLRTMSTSRRTIEGCKSCIHSMPSAAYNRL